MILGLLVLFDMIALAVTSRDAAVKKMGGRNWKKLHRTIYMVLGLVLLHALFVGADFGLRRSPDVRGEADFGSLMTFTSISMAWLVLVLLRRRGLRWTPGFMCRWPGY